MSEIRVKGIASAFYDRPLPNKIRRKIGAVQFPGSSAPYLPLRSFFLLLGTHNRVFWRALIFRLAVSLMCSLPPPPPHALITYDVLLPSSSPKPPPPAPLLFRDVIIINDPPKGGSDPGGVKGGRGNEDPNPTRKVPRHV